MPSRKRRLSSYDDSSKRIRLDSLFSSLSLDDRKELEVNPGLDHTPSTDDINSYIVKKLALQYMDAQKARMSLVKYYDWRILVVYNFQRWVLRLFNRFWRRYNRAHDRKQFKTFRFYHQIMDLLSQTRSITLNHLASILDQENRFEQLQLKRRQQARTDKEEALLHKDLGYNYWDTFEGFDSDEEMMEIEIDGVEEEMEE